MGITGIAPTWAPPLRGPYNSGNVSGLWHYPTHKRFSNYEFAILVGRFTKGVPIVSATTHSFIVISDSHLLALRFSFQFTHGADEHVSM
jgi:hypothetical protein